MCKICRNKKSEMSYLSIGKIERKKEGTTQGTTSAVPSVVDGLGWGRNLGCSILVLNLWENWKILVLF